MGQWDCTRREKQQCNNDIQRSHCFVTYSLPWRMHRYYTRNRDSESKVHSVSATECYWLSAQLQTIVQRFCTWHRRYGPPLQKFCKTIVQLNPFPLSRHTRKRFTIQISFRFRLVHTRANMFLSLNRVSRERAIDTRNLYIEYFYIFINVAINPLIFWFFHARNDSM